MGLSRRKIKRLQSQIDACGESIRRHVSDAPLRAGTLAADIGLRGQPILVTLSDSGIYWSLLADPESVMHMEYSRIAVAEQDEGLIKLTEQNPEYAASLNDPSNPFGETDFIFRIEPTDSGFEFSQLLNRALFRYSPVFSEKRGQVKRFKIRQGIPVFSWSACPYCRTKLASKVEGAVVCSVCRRCFCDADLQPILSEDPRTYARVTGVKPWPIVFEDQLVAKGKTNTWLYRPQGGPGPMVVWDLEPLELMDQLP
jgi:hypothetical protein